MGGGIWQSGGCENIQTSKTNPHMNVHHNARLTAHGRERIVQAILKRELSVKAAALQSGLSERSVRKWLARYRAEGRAGLRDRSSGPQRSPKERRPSPRWRSCWLGVGCASRASRSLARALFPAPLSPGSCAVMAWPGCAISNRPLRWCVINVSSRESCSTSTSRSWAKSCAPVIA